MPLVNNRTWDRLRPLQGDNDQTGVTESTGAFSRLARYWVASHLSIPAIRPYGEKLENGRQRPVYAFDQYGGRRLLINRPQGDAVLDPLAAIGVPTRYTQWGLSGSVALTRPSPGGDLLMDVTGRTGVLIDLFGDDDQKFDPRVTSLDTTSGVLDRWAAKAAPVEVTIEFRTKGRESYEVARQLIEGGGYIVILHDQDRCTSPDCEIDPVRLVMVKSASCTRTSSVLSGTREWSLTCVLRDPIELEKMRRTAETYAPCVTWGEWENYERGVREGKINGNRVTVWGEDKSSILGIPARADDAIDVPVKREVRRITVGGQLDPSSSYAVQMVGGHTYGVEAWVAPAREDVLADKPLQSFNASAIAYVCDEIGGGYSQIQVTNKFTSTQGDWRLLSSTFWLPEDKKFGYPALTCSQPRFRFAGLSMWDQTASETAEGSSPETRTYNSLCRLIAGMPS